MLDWFRTRWPLKLLALGLAFAIWVTVTGENRVIQAFEVPVDLALADDVVLAGPPPSAVEVRLRGPESLVRSINPLRLAFQIDLEDAVPGDRGVLLTKQRLAGVPKGVEITLIHPDRLTVEMDRRARRVLPVAAALQGRPADGYAVYDTQVLPDTLEVEGPETVVEAMARLRTEPIRLDDRTESFSTRVAAVPDSPAVRVLAPRRPEVRVEIDEAPERVTIDGVPVALAGLEQEATVRPSTLRVVLSGPPGLLAGIDAAQLQALADVTGLPAGRRTHKVPVRVEVLDLPPAERVRVEVERVTPAEVSVRLTERKAGG